MSADFKSAIRLYRDHPFYRNFTDGPFVYQCIACSGWRQREVDKRCPCGGSWQEVWEPPAEVYKALMGVRRKATMVRADPLTCSTPGCNHLIPIRSTGLCDFCREC